MMKKAAGIAGIVLLLLIGFMRFDVLPAIGDPDSPANTHVSYYYIEHAIEDTHSPNLVTAMIVDYRAFDTLFETTVMFLAGVGVMLILASHPRSRRRLRRTENHIRFRYREGEPVFRTVNKDVMITILEPLILIYAMYVLFHGEISLGGGFQAGALIALTYIIDVMVIPERTDLPRLSKAGAAALAGIGTFVYAFAGILAMFGGGTFLDFGSLPFLGDTAEGHPAGILAVEIGVTICVMATIITILNAILERIRFDDND